MGICESATSESKRLSVKRGNSPQREGKRANDIVHNRKFERKINQHFTEKPKSPMKRLENLKPEESIIPYQRDNNRKGSQVERKKGRSISLIEKHAIGTKQYKDEINLRVSIQSLIDETNGLPTRKYKVLSKLGDGSFGTVFLAENQITKAKFALKKIPKHNSINDPIYNESPSLALNDFSVKNEINLLKKLDHPNIVKIIEFYNTKKAYYTINDYCPLGELFNQIQLKYTENQLAVLFYQIFSGLCYLHENNICHRDIKLENILISHQEKDVARGIEYFWIKIIDFGTATIFHQRNSEDAIVGSSYYIAPEVFRKKYSDKCDMWSTGVILYMLLVGRPPFDGANDDVIISRIKKGLFNTCNASFVSASPEVQHLIQSLLEVKAEKRLSAKEALKHPWLTKFNGKQLFFNISQDKIMKIVNRLFSYQISSKLQQIVLAFIVHNFPENEEVRDALKIFRQFNASDNGRLTKEELHLGMGMHLNKTLVNTKINDLFTMLDSANNGYLEFEEFLRACLEKEQLLTDNMLQYAFQFIDKDNLNQITSEKIKECFQQDTASVDVFEHLFSEVHQEKEGTIDYEEFKAMMLRM